MSAEDDGFPGICDEPCYVVEKQADFYLAGNPSSPVTCTGGDNAFVYTLKHLSNPTSSFPSPGISLAEFSVAVELELVSSAGFVPGNGIAPTSTVVGPLNGVTWTFPGGGMCPACLNQGQVSERLYICSLGVPRSATDNVSTTAIVLDAPGECLAPVEAPAP